MNKRIYSKGDKKILKAWAFYDWANSVYPLVIGTAVFPIFYGELFVESDYIDFLGINYNCLLYTSPSPRDQRGSGMPSCG